MANQVRNLIEKSVKSYVDFFKRFKKDRYPVPEEIMNREFDPDTELEDNFLILKINILQNNEKIGFTELPMAVCD